MAILFALETLTVTLDRGAPVQMAKDDFRLLRKRCSKIVNRNQACHLFAGAKLRLNTRSRDRIKEPKLKIMAKTKYLKTDCSVLG